MIVQTRRYSKNETNSDLAEKKKLLLTENMALNMPSASILILRIRMLSHLSKSKSGLLQLVLKLQYFHLGQLEGGTREDREGAVPVAPSPAP
jgi:hypothetical protein